MEARASGFDGDGFADLAIGAPGASSGTGNVFVFSVDATLFVGAPLSTVLGASSAGRFYGYATSSSTIEQRLDMTQESRSPWASLF